MKANLHVVLHVNYKIKGEIGPGKKVYSPIALYNYKQIRFE